MSTRPARPCVERCSSLAVPGGDRCRRHKRARQQAYNQHQRPARHAFYQSSEWKRFKVEAANELGRQCVDCGKTTGRLDLDHNVSIDERPDLALEMSNVQWRCGSCHSRKTAKEGGRWGREGTR